MDNQKATTINLNLGYIIMALFAVPLIVAVPSWYTTMEMIGAVIIIITQGMIAFSQSVIIYNLFKNKKAGIEVPPCVELYASSSAFGGWAVAIVMAVSMYAQGMETLFILYLIGAIFINGLRFEKIRIWRNLFPAQG